MAYPAIPVTSYVANKIILVVLFYRAGADCCGDGNFSIIYAPP